MKNFILPAITLCLSLSSHAELSTDNQFNNDYVGEWGRLKLDNNQLCSEAGEAIQLKGWTTAGINKKGAMNYLTDKDFDAMKTWGANIVRLSVIPKDSNCEYTAATDSLLKVLIERASQRKMYAIVNWNIIYEDYAKHQEKAKTMFGNISKWTAENGYKNVLYDIAGAGNNTSPWNDLKKYAEELLPIIEANDPGAMVIVGTPNFNHYTNLAAESPIDKTKYPNVGILYACQFYACTHISTVDASMRSAAASIPVFVTEWSSARYDLENDELCAGNSDVYLSHLSRENSGKQLISWCYWVWGDDYIDYAESGTTDGKGQTEDNLTQYGKYIVSRLNPAPICCPIDDGGWNVQYIPLEGQNYGILNIGRFNPGEESIAYHDLNSSAYTDAERTELKTGDEAIGTEAELCNMGALLSGKEDLLDAFRFDDCVDVTDNIAGLSSVQDSVGDGYGSYGQTLHSLISTEPGEWINYNIYVTQKGYYTVHCLTNSGTSNKGTIGMAIKGGTNENQNGNIIRSWSTRNLDKAEQTEIQSFCLNKTTQCGLYPDGTQDANGAANGDPGIPSTCWGWTPVGATEAEQEDLVVLFKYEGLQKLSIYISPDTEFSPGEFSNFMFTFKGDDIPDTEFTGTELTNNDMNVSISPNPTDGKFTVSTEGQSRIDIYNLMGEKVYSQEAEGETEIDQQLTNGIYTVRITNERGVKSMKLVRK